MGALAYEYEWNDSTLDFQFQSPGCSQCQLQVASYQTLGGRGNEPGTRGLASGWLSCVKITLQKILIKDLMVFKAHDSTFGGVVATFSLLGLHDFVLDKYLMITLTDCGHID